MPRKPSLVRYIEQARKNGSSEQEIRSALLDAGWQMDIILSAMHTNMYTSMDNQVVPQTKSRLRRSKEIVQAHAIRAGKTISRKRRKSRK